LWILSGCCASLVDFSRELRHFGGFKPGVKLFLWISAGCYFNLADSNRLLWQMVDINVCYGSLEDLS
jgi:hypothetical protein